jgi:hypothetical protein
VTANSAAYCSGGGLYYSAAYNSIVYFNSIGCSSSTQSNNYNTAFAYSCTTPLPIGEGNINPDPLFMDGPNGNWRLQSNSPCINTGNNAFAVGAVDLDGRPRIVAGTVDIGAYEFQNPASLISYAWLLQHGLPTDGSADFTDADHDGMNTLQEWICGTDPGDAASALRLLTPSRNLSGLQVTWQSTSNKLYYLQRGTNLLVQPAFSSIVSNLPGLPGATSFTDTNATGTGPYFYRVGVQP